MNEAARKIDDFFPPLPFWSTLQDVYAAFFIQFWRILRLSILPFILSFIAYLAGDVWLSVQDISVATFWVTTGVVQAIEITLFYFFSLALFRLLLLGPNGADVEQERNWLVRLVSYGMRSAGLFLPLMTLTIASFFALRALAGWEPVGLLVALPLTLLILFYLFVRLGFTLPAAAVDAPYSVFDSWQATARVGMRALLITLLSILPLFLLTCVAIVGLNRIVRPVELHFSDAVIYQITSAYWITVPLGLLLSYFLAAMVVIALSVMFYVRTGWRPGAVRADR